MVDKLRCRCRFGMREAVDGQGSAEWEVDPDGCPAVLSAGDVAAHEAACAFELLTCGNASCNGASCDRQFRRGESAAHQAACPLRPQPCSNGCGKQLPQCDQAEHKAKDCPRQVVCCIYEGCNTTFRRSDTDRHNFESMAAHLAGERRAHIMSRAALHFQEQTLKANTSAEAWATLSSDDAEQVQSVLYKLGRNRYSPGRLNARGAAVVCTATLKAMRKHSAHAGVQKAGLLCLEVFAPHLQPNQLRQLSAEAISALLGAMSAHLADSEVQYSACAALAAGNMLESSRMLVLDTFLTSSLTAGDCTPALLAALRTHPDHSMLQAAGLRALASALMSHRNKTAAVADEPETRVASALVAVDALLRHRLDTGVVQHGCAVLRSCNGAERSAELQRGAAKVVRTVLSVADFHGSHATLVIHAFDSLAMLFEDVVFAKACAATMQVSGVGVGRYINGLEVLLRALDERINSNDLVTLACLRAISALVKHRAVAAHMFVHNRELFVKAVTAVRQSMHRWRDATEHAAMVLVRWSSSVSASDMSGPLVEEMASALVREAQVPTLCSPSFYVVMCVHFTHFGVNMHHRRRLVAAGALGAVVEAMRKCCSEPAVLQVGCRALVVLCQEPRHKAVAIAAGAQQVVSAAAAAATGHADNGVAVAAALALFSPAPAPQAPQAAS